jgi:hypothetical protein
VLFISLFSALAGDSDFGNGTCPFAATAPHLHISVSSYVPFLLLVGSKVFVLQPGVVEGDTLLSFYLHSPR